MLTLIENALLVCVAMVFSAFVTQLVIHCQRDKDYRLRKLDELHSAFLKSQEYLSLSFTKHVEFSRGFIELAELK